MVSKLHELPLGSPTSTEIRLLYALDVFLVASCTTILSRQRTEDRLTRIHVAVAKYADA